MKITELNNRQLVQAIEKYQNIVDHLLKERNVRLKTAKDKNELYTKKELAQLTAKAPVKNSQEMPNTGLTLNEDELKQFEDANKNMANKAQEDEDMIRVTTLLKLTKENMAELQQNAKNIKKSESKNKK